MKKKVFVLIGLISLTFFVYTESGYELIKLRKNIYRCTSKVPYPSNFLIFISCDGVLLIDSGHLKPRVELKKIIKDVGGENQKIKYLINTHAHIDHTGGNFSMNRETVIIGSNLLRSTLKSYSYVLYEFPEKALPAISFDKSVILHFGGEVFHLYKLPGSHDGTDIIVHLEKSKIVCMGDIAYGMSFPSIDAYTGNLLKYPETIKKALNLFPDDVTIVSGHGSEISVSELKKFGEMISDSIRVVKAELKKGVSVSEMIQRNVLKKWRDFGHGVAGTMPYWIKRVADAGPGKYIGSPAEELYKVLIRSSGRDAVLRYNELKANHPEEYPFFEILIRKVGEWLLLKERYEDAVEIFKLQIKEYPKSWFAYQILGETYLKMGKREEAEQSLKESLKLNPKNHAGKEMLK